MNLQRIKHWLSIEDCIAEIRYIVHIYKIVIYHTQNGLNTVLELIDDKT